MTTHNVKIQCNSAVSCDYHRIYLPFKYLEAKAKNPVFYFNRLPSIAIDITTAMKKLGVKLVCDVDDYWILDETHFLYKAYIESGVAKKMVNILSKADVVTTTTPELATKIREFNKNVVVIPNALPFDDGQFTRSPEKESGSEFVFVGGGSHRRDLSLITTKQDKLTIAGYSDVDEWNRIASDFPKTTKFDEGKPSAEYMSLYDGHKVAIAPLITNAFNVCKSNLKVLEAGCKGLPIITSKCLPYFNSVDKNVVIYAANKSDWAYQMHKLSKNPNYAEDVGERLAEHVRKHYQIKKANLIRKQIIESL
ncbi:hypothetical protein SB5439_04996 [Klebsiella variicola]|uniref:glycosyltransferase family protein n=1 Tax=Klebsiella variicola TaxID=244366 RepID=UPI00109D76A6|nr:glycosyltransferase [Klebsiella variicola]VGQ11796.1 hypothetical protein SB5439_04996 [Klebsiella variicola]